jgi:hypothetical protein
MLIAGLDYTSTQQPSKEINMNLNETVRNAWKLYDKIDELQSFLWQRYHREFLDLMEEEEFKNQQYLKDSQRSL